MLILGISKNIFSFLCRTTFDGLSSLEELDLQNNRLSYLKPDTFKDLKNLKIIRLNYNNLTMKKSPDFGYSLLNQCDQIEQIYLQHNLVDTIFQDWLISHTRLRILDLKYNKLKSLSVSIVHFFSI